MEAASLAAPLGSRLAEAGSKRDRDRMFAAVHDLEFAPLADRTLVHVPGQNKLRARVDEAGKDACTPRERWLPGAPGRAKQVVMQDDDAKRSLGCPRQLTRDPLELALGDRARLMAPRAH